MPENSPTVRHRRLGKELRSLRERAGLSPAAAAAALGWSKSKLTRFETADTRPQPGDVATMLGLYGGDDALKLALMQLARDVRVRGWWAAYSDVLAPSFAELENDASSIRSWQVEVIPGLLQTPAYARALISMDASDDADVNRRLQAREHRKAVLARTDAPTLDVVLDEAVLRRPVGGHEVMREQLGALLDVSRRPNVSIRVLPTESGAYPYIGNGSVMIFGFPREIDPDVAYIESFAGGLFVEDVEQVRTCEEKVQEISAEALSEEDSAALIRALSEE